jgi:hypothetical protein
VDDAEELAALNGIEVGSCCCTLTSTSCGPDLFYLQNAESHAVADVGECLHCHTALMTSQPLAHITTAELLSLSLSLCVSLKLDISSHCTLSLWITDPHHPFLRLRCARRVQSMPTFKCFHNGVEVGHTTGSDFEKLRAMIAKHTPSSSVEDGAAAASAATAPSSAGASAASSAPSPRPAKRVHIDRALDLPPLPDLPPDGKLRVFITGPSSGSGKSTVALGLMAALLKRGLAPHLLG